MHCRVGMAESTLFPALLEAATSRCNRSHPELHYNEACLLLTSTAHSTIHVFAQSSECLQCDLQKWALVEPSTSVSLLVQSKFPLSIAFKTSLLQPICSFHQEFGGKGLFELNISDSECSEIVTVRDPEGVLLPFLLCLLLLAGLWLLWCVLRRLSSTQCCTRLSPLGSSTTDMENDLGSPGGSQVVSLQAAVLSKQRARVKSLDTMRGICIALMIFVNYGGGKYIIFEHSSWNGLTIADVIFPLFMWIMGLSMALSMRSQLRSGVTRCQLASRVLRRGGTLVAIGISLNSFGHNSLQELRIPGVLQRLGLCFVLVGLMEARHMRLQSAQQPLPRTCAWLQDLYHAWPQWLVVAAFTTLYCFLTFKLPVPGCPTGYLGPGGLHQHSHFANCTGGAAGFVDRLVMGEAHLYQRPTCKKIYQTQLPYDPEGILGMLTSVLLVHLGVQAGRVMLTYCNPCSRIIRWSIWALSTGLLAGALCDFTKEGGLVPINKNLYSLSFVLATAALGFASLALLYLIVDVKHWWGGEPFYFAGMNSLLLYIGHEFTSTMLPWRWQPLSSSQAELLAMDVWGAGLWLLVAYRLHQANCFLTV